MLQPGVVRDRFLHRARPVTCSTATTAHCAHGENTHRLQAAGQQIQHDLRICICKHQIEFIPCGVLVVWREQLGHTSVRLLLPPPSPCFLAVDRSAPSPAQQV